MSTIADTPILVPMTSFYWMVSLLISLAMHITPVKHWFSL